jgi:putative holliday junction resolvase
MSGARRKGPATAAAAAGRVLGIDYGRRRLGLAISDESGMLARPLETLTPRNRADRMRLVREAVRRHRPARIVVGLPLRLDGTRGEMAEEAARFARRIEKEVGLPVELADERLSSWQAGQLAAERPRSARTGRRRMVPADHQAAAVFLQDYLNRRRQAARD